LKGKLHPATLIFQALRMCVNRELEEVTEGITKAIQHLSSGGMIGVISFHSLEDRIVKHIFRQASARSKARVTEPILHVMTKKPVTPSPKEMRANPRSRSAKMRVAEKI
jgi:16S rRNA (cytosine1402-N4)-methyltransferase